VAKQVARSPVADVVYDRATDTLAFRFSETPRPAVAEEAGDEVWVRYESQTRRVVSVEVLNLSARVKEAFGPSLTYTERGDEDRLAALHGLSLPLETP